MAVDKEANSLRESTLTILSLTCAYSIDIYLVGPLNPACEEKTVLLTAIDRWTGWPDACPMSMLRPMHAQMYVSRLSYWAFQMS